MFPVSQVTERRQSLVGGGGGRKLLLVSSCSKVLDTLNLESLHQYKINSRSQKCGKSSPAQSLLALKSLHQGRSSGSVGVAVVVVWRRGVGVRSAPTGRVAHYWRV